MLNFNEHQTKLFQEAGEAHGRVQDQLVKNEPGLYQLGQRLRDNSPPFIMICARGSSSHAGVYARYLIETQLQVPVMFVAPSVNSIFSVKQNLSGVLFLAISQSGQSPDILSAAQASKQGGAFVVAFVNDQNSPLAALADMVVQIHAGVEKSVAATKTFICTLAAIAQWVACWSQNGPLTQGLTALPDRLEKAFKLEWGPAVERLESAQSLFVVSRGLGLSIAKEAALKFKETSCIHAEGFSAAEVKHGPMALVKTGFPVLIFATGDKAQPSIDNVAKTFISRGAQIFATGADYDGALSLPTTECPVPELRAIITIQTFYRFINALSLRRGFDPDNPEYLNKITETV